MQGIHEFIPTRDKILYINTLLKVGYDTLDFGSFVSPKAIPQMADTDEVVQSIELEGSRSKLLAIVANEKGAKRAVAYDQISYLGYPFSISETFQKRNTRSSIKQSFDRVKKISRLCQEFGKELVIYISMGFGNPYGDHYDTALVKEWVDRIHPLGVNIFSLSDTVGVAKPETISFLFSHLTEAYPEIEFGAHFHTAPHNWREKIEAAYKNGCRRFDGAIKGYGGCPMAKDELMGNMPTENMINYFDREVLGPNFSIEAFEDALRMSLKVFPR
jgi:hydroxymethylglutaryl-CoA lyase